MKVSNCLPYLLCGVLTLVGCSGEQQTTTNVDEVAQMLQVNERKMLGAWQSDDLQYGYEFHSSPTKRGSIVEIDIQESFFRPEGVIYKQGKPESYFTWSVLANGALRLEIKDSSCLSRPLVICNTDNIQTIQVTGSNEQNLTFLISEDVNLDGRSDESFQWRLSKKVLPDMTIGERAFFITKLNRANNQYLLAGNSNELTMYLPFAQGDRKFVEQQRDEYIIELNQQEDIVLSEDLYVYGLGEQSVQLKRHYQPILIYPAFDEGFIVSAEYEVEILLDGTYEQSDIDLDGTLLSRKVSRHVDVVNAGQYAPQIEYGKPYYGNFLEVFDVEGLDNGIANKVIFENDSTARLFSGDVLSDSPFMNEVFQWRQGAHAGEFVLENDNVVVYLEFLHGEKERYRVVTSTYIKADEEFITKYSSEFLFAEYGDIDLSTLFPLEFEFINIDGVIVSPVRLLDDGEVELVNVDEVEGGYWFFNGTNELIRFECTTISEVIIEDYQECLDSFEYVATPQTVTDYSHITRIRFINKIGNDYLVQYDAAFWGGRWGREDHIRRFTSYYQWFHLAE